MDARVELQERIEVLTCAIVQDTHNCDLYMERGRLYHRQGRFDKALNDFIRVTDLTEENHPEAEGYITMIRGIFDFRFMESYNV